jgi:alpha-beta hydrolase superfamily lysophospholipase
MASAQELTFVLTPDGPAPEAAWFVNKHKMKMYVGRCMPLEGVAPRCVVVFLHGLDDHSGRWRHVAEALRSAPDVLAACYTPDWQGHGRSSGNFGPRGWEIPNHSIVSLESVVDDLEVVIQYAHNSHPNVPFFLAGHSMGGMISVKTLTQRPKTTSLISGGLVLVSPALAPFARDDTWFNWNVLLPTVKNVVRPIYPGLVSPIPLGKELTHDKDFQAEDQRDPLRGITPTGWTMCCAGLEMKRFKEPGVFERVKLPWLLLGTPDDTLVSPAGFDAFEQRSATPKELRSRHDFPGMWHEILRETPEQREKALKIMVNWLAKRIAAVPHSRL